MPDESTDHRLAVFVRYSEQLSWVLRAEIGGVCTMMNDFSSRIFTQVLLSCQCLIRTTGGRIETVGILKTTAR